MSGACEEPKLSPSGGTRVICADNDNPVDAVDQWDELRGHGFPRERGIDGVSVTMTKPKRECSSARGGRLASFATSDTKRRTVKSQNCSLFCCQQKYKSSKNVVCTGKRRRNVSRRAFITTHVNSCPRGNAVLVRMQMQNPRYVSPASAGHAPLPLLRGRPEDGKQRIPAHRPHPEGNKQNQQVRHHDAR